MEMICAIVHQLTKNLSPEEIERSGFAPYYVDHTLALWPQAASGAPWTATYFQSKGDPITDLHEDLAAEQKARTTYDNILRLVKDPEVCDPIRFLRQREIVHYQRFGGADPTFFGRDGKLRGLKRQCYEGGIRIPFIVRWPGKVPEGTVNDHQLAFYDLMPTFCDLAGVKNYVKKYTNKKKDMDYFDGISFAPTLLGQEGQKKHDFLYWEFDETDQIGVRMGDWKMVVKKGTPFLYNLATDIHEDHDIAAGHPDIVKQMKEIIRTQHTPNPHFSVTLPSFE